VGLVHAEEPRTPPFFKSGILTAGHTLPFHSCAYGVVDPAQPPMSPIARQPLPESDESPEIPSSREARGPELLWLTDQVEPFHVSINGYIGSSEVVAYPTAKQSDGPVQETPFRVFHPLSGSGLDSTDHDIPYQDMTSDSEEPELVGMSPTATQSEPVEPRHVMPLKTAPLGSGEPDSSVQLDPSHISIRPDSGNLDSKVVDS
jgi:hypothetical protein